MSKKVIKEGKSSPPYCESLGDKEKARYMEKLSLIDGNDSYEVKTFSADQKLLPSILYPVQKLNQDILLCTPILL